MNYTTYNCPVLGTYTIVASAEGILRISFGHKIPEGAINEETPIIQEAQKQLQAYSEGKLTNFTLPLLPRGTAFQQRVWAELLLVPYGETISYKTLAERVGNAKASRAVAGACHNNPIAIVIPCHRIVGSNGSLTGYAGGLPLKETLLKREAISSQ